MAVSSSLKRMLIFLAAFTILNAVNATPVLHPPTNVPTHRALHAEDGAVTINVEKRAAAKVSIVHSRRIHLALGYFVNWGIYSPRLFLPQNINVATLTHILYAFADVDPNSGNIILSDLYADTQDHFPTDSWSETGNNLYGCLKQMYLLKLANRNLKVSLSVGGWTYSQAGHFSFVTNAASRATFVTSAVQMIENYGFDGIDLDFEYPSNAAQGQGFADLFTELRTAFDALAAKKGDATTYQLTAAVSAGLANNAFLVIPQMDKALSYWNLMAYDYAGSWLTWSDNQANLYGGTRTNVSTDAAVKHFVSGGATVGKIVMGIPLYGHAFEETAGLGQPYNGIGPGTFPGGAGIYSYNTLPLAGAKVFENTTDVSSYSYNSATQELISYDTPNIVKLKAAYTNANGLAGLMFWDLSTDSTGATSLVTVSANVLGALDQTKNHISYPNSEWDNIRSNMGTTTTTTSGTTGPTGTPGSGICAGVAAWVSTVPYSYAIWSIYSAPGNKVTYNGHLWTNQCNSYAAGVWVDGGAC
ncbi:glycosyl hydrolases family 18-domain-containing protein [Mycena alexandri]|uniref:Glycosyl hydrolases family 18-domain-containing protein n=1 Tax=Mycena alexandri TaxID=1745969 RepID=A0AAD6X8P9_9AGAR|nr:glycosyl hydrolases family 18-domain-containing protein [Mycena alexandri]